MAAKKETEKYIDTGEMARISSYAQRTMHIYLKTGEIPGGFQMGNASNAKWVVAERTFYKWLADMKKKKKKKAQ